MMDKPVVLLLETEAVARHALGEYLRECGFMVVEATNTDEAMTLFQGADVSVEPALIDVRAAGAADAFGLARWIRARYDWNVVMVGAIDAAARKAKEICESGPTLARPYEHTAVVTLIKRLRAERDRRQ